MAGKIQSRVGATSNPETRNASRDRVLRALEFQSPDTIPSYDNFWGEFLVMWRRWKGLPPDGQTAPIPEAAPSDWDIYEYYGNDIRIAAADETFWPSKVRPLEPDGNHFRERDGWGRIVRKLGNFTVTESPGMASNDRNLEALDFEPANLQSRYQQFDQLLEVERDHRCVFAKIGGPFIRISFLRGLETWLMEIVSDEGFARALADAVASHLFDIGLESMRRGNLWDSGIWIYDDMASNTGPLISPRSFERIFLPGYVKLIDGFRSAGARHICFHSDGDIRQLLPMLVEAGISAINPVEYKANMRIDALRKQHGDKLAYIGGVDNTHIMPSGDDEAFRRHVGEILAMGRDGGVVIGADTLATDVAPERYEAYRRQIRPDWLPPAR